MTANLKEWKKYSTISPSYRNVDHYKSFPVSDRNENDQEHIVFDSYILQTINIILNNTIAKQEYLLQDGCRQQLR